MGRRPQGRELEKNVPQRGQRSSECSRTGKRQVWPEQVSWRRVGEEVVRWAGPCGRGVGGGRQRGTTTLEHHLAAPTQAEQILLQKPAIPSW